MHKGWLLALVVTTVTVSLSLMSCATNNGDDRSIESLAEDQAAADVSYIGSETCLECHEGYQEPLSQTRHWQETDPRSPGALENGCEMCHGPGETHVAEEGSLEVPGLVAYGPNAQASTGRQNRMCLQCHQRDILHWQGSPHDSDELSCTGCHSIHSYDQAIARDREQKFCYRCHQNVRAETYRPFRHPIKEELLLCSDCHNPHGSAGPALLSQLTLNETCYRCHAEKRGPFLWEHFPATEDCSICHLPHGSLQPALLNKSQPLLCQSCHQSVRLPHVRRAYTLGLPRGGGEGPGGGGGGGPSNGGGGDGTGGGGPGGGEGPGLGPGGGIGGGGGPGGGIGGGGGPGVLVNLSATRQDGGLGPGEGEGPGLGPGEGEGPGLGPGGGEGPGQGPGGGEGPGLGEGGGPDRFLLGLSCMNCHSQVHGSNHPSGAKLLR